MRPMLAALVERCFQHQGIDPELTELALGLVPKQEIERGRLYLDMCQAVDVLTCPELPVTDLVVWACNEYGVSPSTFWRAWAYYQLPESR